MGASPVPHLMAITLFLVIQAMIFGGELAEKSFEEFEQPDSDGGFLGGALDILGSIIKAIWGVIQFFFNAITANVGGAPWFIRVPVSTYIVSVFIWSLAELIRGK